MERSPWRANPPRHANRSISKPPPRAQPFSHKSAPLTPPSPALPPCSSHPTSLRHRHLPSTPPRKCLTVRSRPLRINSSTSVASTSVPISAFAPCPPTYPADGQGRRTGQGRRQELRDRRRGHRGGTGPHATPTESCRTPATHTCILRQVCTAPLPTPVLPPFRAPIVFRLCIFTI